MSKPKPATSTLEVPKGSDQVVGRPVMILYILDPGEEQIQSLDQAFRVTYDMDVLEAMTADGHLPVLISKLELEVRKLATRFMESLTCPECGGKRTDPKNTAEPPVIALCRNSFHQTPMERAN